jgi:hypothetical protein
MARGPLLLAALALAACGSPDGEAVAGRAAPPARCVGITPERVVDGGEAGFHQLAAVTWGPEGRLFVLDAGDNRLVAFDEGGRELWRRGREGAGPAELRQPMGLAFRDGRLVTRDHGNDRLSFWTAEGEPAGTTPLGEFAFPGNPGWVAALPGGRVAAMTMPAMRLGDARELPGAVVVGERGGARVDTVATFTFPAPQMVQAGGMRMPVMPSFAPYPQVAAAADGGLFVSRGGAYEIERYDAAGKARGVVRGPVEPPPFTAEDRELAARALPPGAVADQIEYPGTLPAVAGLATSAEGDLLVRTSWHAGGLVRWDRWSSAGEYRGSAMIPRALRSVAVQGEHVAAIQADSLDVQSVAVFRLGGAAECVGPLPGR